MLEMLIILILAQVPQDLKDLTLHSRQVNMTTAWWPSWSQGFTWNLGDKRIEVRRSERATPQSPWQNSPNTYTTSFEISAVCGRDGGDDLFVAGIQPSGDVVIERWTFPERNGRWRHIPPTMLPIGTPMAKPYSGTTEIKGGIWSAPPAAHIAPARTVLLDSNGFQCVRGMAVDPEGRFLLFQDHDDGTLYRIRLDQGAPGAPQVLYTPAQIPELTVTVRMNVGDHVETGHRVWALIEPNASGEPKGIRVVLRDTNNDGAFESTEVLEFKDFKPAFLDPGDCKFGWKEPHG